MLFIGEAMLGLDMLRDQCVHRVQLPLSAQAISEGASVTVGAAGVKGATVTWGYLVSRKATLCRGTLRVRVPGSTDPSNNAWAL